MRRLGLLLALAACNPPGLTLEVVIADPGIKKVELFAGTHCSGDCPRGTVPPQLPPMAVDDAYLVVDQVPWTVSDTDFTDGVAGFRIESAQDTSLDILVVLGYDAQDQIRWSSTFHGVDIPKGDSAHWRVQLSPTAPIAPSSTPPPAGSQRIARWQQPSKQLPSCLLLERWGDGGRPTRELVVPETDHDCDEVVAASECAPWIPNATSAPPTIEDARCLLAGTLAGGATEVCMLGGPECNESAMTPREGCVQLDQPYCAPSALCGCVGSPDVVACVTAKIDGGISTSAIPYLKCTIQLDSDGTSCSDSYIEADAGPYLSGGSTKCSAVALHPAMTPLAGFASYLEIDATSKLKIEAFNEPCKLDLYFAGSSMPQTKLALAALELDNGNHLVVPVRIDLEATGCAEPSRCEFFRPDSNITDSIWQCVGPTVAPRCAPDPDHGCAGPMCNGQCCGAGESCTPNGCACGTVGSRCTGGDTCTVGQPTYDQCGSLCCGVTQPCPF